MAIRTSHKMAWLLSACTILLLYFQFSRAEKKQKDFYEQFKLDYGTEDNIRSIATLRAAPEVISKDKLTYLRTIDSFKRWMNIKVEHGPETITETLRPYHVRVLFVLNFEKSHFIYDKGCRFREQSGFESRRKSGKSEIVWFSTFSNYLTSLYLENSHR